MYRSLRLAACAILLGTVLMTLAISMGSNAKGPEAGTPYASALSNAGIPSALAQENACTHTTCFEQLHGGVICKSTPNLNIDCLDEFGSCNTTPCP